MNGFIDVSTADEDPDTYLFHQNLYQNLPKSDIAM